MKKYVMLLVLCIAGLHASAQFFSAKKVVPDNKRYKDDIAVKNTTPYTIKDVVVYHNDVELGKIFGIEAYDDEKAWRSHNQLQQFTGEKLFIAFECAEAHRFNDELFIDFSEHKHDLLITISSKRERDRKQAEYEEWQRRNMENQNTSSSSGGGFLDGILGLMNATQQTIDLVNKTKGLNKSSSSETYGSDYGTSSTSPSTGGSSSTGRIEKDVPCDKCGGSGKCSALRGVNREYYCHGSKKCGHCNGKGKGDISGMWDSSLEKRKCNYCNGSGRCKYCNGSGQCDKCKGKGKVKKYF